MGYAQENIKPYGDGGQKKEAVRRMFDNIAPAYDRLNRCMSWNIDASWRRRTLRPLVPLKPGKILDVATGTGDLALMAVWMLNPESVVGADISEGMMDIGREKAVKAGLADRISFVREDCGALSFADGVFDAVTSAYGIRNFQNLDVCLGEICRVLRKGGVFVAVEATTPVRFPVKQLFRFYFRRVVPLLGRAVAGDRAAYEYLDRTVEAFPQGEQMTGILLRAGFREASFERMTLGMCTRYTAVK